MDTSPPPEPPSRLPVALGRYTLEELVGKGGNGWVYRSTLRGPAGFRKRLALKLVRASTEMDVAAEARIGALLDHPNLVAIHDLIREGPWWLIAMEWVSGSNLRELVKRHGAMPGLALQQLACSIAGALAHAHGQPQPVVHRDLKPSNVLVTPKAHVKVADLGLAVLAGYVSQNLIGSPGYMAPEQVTPGAQLDPRTDQFALGVILAEMALGYRMIHGRSIEHVWRGHRWMANEIAEGALQRRIDAVIPGLGPIVARCLHLDPNGRFANCDELHRALQSLSVEGEELAEWVQRGSDERTDGGRPPQAHRSTGLRNDRPLIGRDNDLKRLEALVQDHSVVTVYGPGGVGKTSLVQAFGQEAAARYPGGVVWCDATATTDIATLCSVVSGALGLPLDARHEDEVVTQVGRQLQECDEALIVLDGIDRSPEAARHILDAWRTQAPHLRWIVTTRHRPRIKGEAGFPLAPLSRRDTVELLRAQTGGTSAWRSPSAELILVEIASHLDGIPLAVELAAAQAPSLDPEALLRRLHDRFEVLTDGVRTLEGVLRESWEELPTDVRHVLAQLSIFRGGFSVEDADGVVVGPHEGTSGMLDILTVLLDRSFITARTRSDGQPRFSLLESVRQFAAGHLAHPDQVALRHAQWFARRAHPDVVASAPEANLDPRSYRDLANLEAALQFAVNLADPSVAARCAIGAVRLFSTRGPVQRGLDLARLALSVAPDHPGLLTLAATVALQVADADAMVWAEQAVKRSTSPRERADALHVLGRILHQDQRVAEACEALEHALEEARPLGNRLLEGYIALSLGEAQTTLRQGDSRGVLGFAYRLGRRTKAVALQASALIQLGRHASHTGHLDEAQQRLQQALEVTKNVPGLTAEAHNQLGVVERLRGNLDKAQRHFADALAMHRRLGQSRHAITTLGRLAIVAGIAGDLLEAKARLQSAVDVSIEMGDLLNVGVNGLNLAAMHERLGELHEARTLVEKVRPLFDSNDTSRHLRTCDNHLVLLDIEADRCEAAVQRAMRNVEQESARISSGSERVTSLTLLARALGDLGHGGKALSFAELALEESLDEPMVSAMAKVELGIARRRLGRPNAKAMLDEALQDARTSQDAWAVAYVQLRIAELAMHERDAAGLATHAEALIAQKLEPMHGFALHAAGLHGVAAIWGGRVTAPTVNRITHELEKLGFMAR
ncbi:MAG: protein kinase, partial [Myxococcota bacterium]